MSSRTCRRFRTKSYRRIKIKKGESRHHRVPRSRNGTDHEANISVVTEIQHQAWHILFSNLDPHTIADIISQKWISPEYKFVCVPIQYEPFV